MILALVMIAGAAGAETVWVMCQPDSRVNIRSRPSGRSEAVGYAECGDGFATDGKQKNGFVHVFASVEAGEGWISAGYLVWEQPEQVGRQMVISAKGRVNARKTIGGKRRCWVRPGDTVTVYWAADWAVTNKGFIQTKYLAEGVGDE